MDLTGGTPSGIVSQGDSCVLVYPGSNNILENNIGESAGASVEIETLQGHVASGNKFYGNIDISSRYSALFRGRTNGEVVDSVLLNHLSVNAVNTGPYFRGNRNSQCTQCTIIGTPHGISVDQVSTFPPTPPRSVFLTNTLVVNSTRRAYSVDTSAVENWGIDYAVAMATTGTTFSRAAGESRITNEVVTATDQMGNCRVWVPTTATLLKGKGLGNADIGAEVLYAYVNGVLTSTKLWDTGNSGKWLGGLGARINGINTPFSSTLKVANADINTVTISAADVHSRLNIMSNGCLPLGY
jgi:hypothetical protein